MNNRLEELLSKHYTDEESACAPLDDAILKRAVDAAPAPVPASRLARLGEGIASRLRTLRPRLVGQIAATAAAVALAVGLLVPVLRHTTPPVTVDGDPFGPLTSHDSLPEWYTPGDLRLTATTLYYGAENKENPFVPMLSSPEQAKKTLNLPESVYTTAVASDRYLYLVYDSMPDPRSPVPSPFLYDLKEEKILNFGTRLAKEHPDLFGGIFEDGSDLKAVTFTSDPDLCCIRIGTGSDLRSYLVRVSTTEVTPLPEKTSLLSLSPDGARAVLMEKDWKGSCVRLWELASETATELLPFSNLYSVTGEITFSPDGKQLLLYVTKVGTTTVLADSTEATWFLCDLSGETAPISGKGKVVRFTADGKGLIVRDGEGVKLLSRADLSPLDGDTPLLRSDRYEPTFYQTEQGRGFKLVPLFEGEEEIVLSERVEASYARGDFLFLLERDPDRILLYSYRYNSYLAIPLSEGHLDLAKDLFLALSPDGKDLTLYATVNRFLPTPPQTEPPESDPTVTDSPTTEPPETEPPQTLPPAVEPKPLPDEPVSLPLTYHTAYAPIRDIAIEYGKNIGGTYIPFRIADGNALAELLDRMDGICYEDLTLSGADRYDVWRERYSMEWFDKNILYVIQMSSNSGFDLNEGAMSNTLVPPSVKKLELKAQGQNGSYMDFNVEIENTPCRYESAVFLIGIELAREDFEAYGKSPVLNLEIVADRAEEKPLSFPPEAANRPDSHPIVLAERFSYQPVWVPFYNGAAFQDSNISIIRDYDGLSYYLKGGGAARSFYEMDASIYGLPTLREQLEKYSPAWFEDRVLLLAITYTNSESRLPTWKKPLEKGTPPPSVVTHVYLQDGMLYVAAGNPPTEEECYHMPGYYFVFIELERDMLFADPSTVSRLISAELTRPWEKELSHTALKTKVDPASSQSRKELVPLSIEGSAILWLKSVRTIEEQGVKRLNAYVKVGPDFYGYSHSIKGLEPFYQAVTEDGPYEVVFDPDYVKYVDGETARELLDAPSISYALLYRVFGGEIPVKEVRPAPADVNPYLADTYSVRRAGEEMVTTTVAAKLSGIFTAKVTDIRYDARGFLYAVTLDDGNRSYSIRIHEQVATGLSVGQTYRFNLSTDRLSFVAPSLIGKSLRLDQVENEIDWDDMTFRPATKAEQAAMTCELTFLKPTASHAYRQEAISRIDLPSYAGAMKLKSGQREGNPVSPVVLVLYEELLAMVEELRVEYDTSATHEKMPQIPSLDTLLTRYDEEWFRTHDLILFSPGFCSSNDSKMVFYGPDETVSFPFRQSLSRQGDQLRIFQDLGYHEGGAYCLLYEVEKSAGITSARVIYDLCWPE